MNTSDLIKKLGGYGADLDGIADRFMGDDELYRRCFEDFLTDENFAGLEQALADGDYAAAFQAAHSLKGLSANLGLTPFYDAVFVLVELLRDKKRVEVADEYAAVRTALQTLRELESDDGNPNLASESDSAAQTSGNDGAVKASVTETSEEHEIKRNKRTDVFLILTATAFAISIIFMTFLFASLVERYRENTTLESAMYLEEINYQIRLYVEQKLTNDRNKIRSISNSVVNGGFTDDDSALLRFISREFDIWNIDDLTIYTEDGGIVSAAGEAIGKEDAADIISRSKEQGEYLKIIDSDVIFALPVETELKINGSRITAVSITQDLHDLLRDMRLSSFNGKGRMYLTQLGGEIISRLTDRTHDSAANIKTMLEGKKIFTFRDSSEIASDLFGVAAPTAFIIESSDETAYIVSSQIKTMSTTLLLFYLVPEDVVNSTMNSFSRYITLISIITVVFFAFTALVFFISIYNRRKKQFDDALSLRERMFDYISMNTGTAFGLFKLGSNASLYQTKNAEYITNTKNLYISENNGVFSLNDDNGSFTPVNKTLKDWDGKSDFRSDFLPIIRDGETRYFRLYVYRCEAESDELIIIAQDWTRDYESEAATKEALKMAERANEAKSRFLSNMSHDIRTPMNAIMNMTHFAKESVGDSRRQLSYLRTIEESSEHLLSIINDVLDMSRIESGLTTIEEKPFDLLGELKRLSDIVRPLCVTHRLQYIEDFIDISGGVIGDRVKVSQILMNLLSNAVKFTPERGAVRFAAENIQSLREDTVNIRFTVEDNGIGISAAELPHIFEPFKRADDRRIGKVEGTGLGLSICRSYVSAMGGVIKCESEEGSGSVFTVELFFKKTELSPAHEPKAEASELPFAGMRALLCEDNHTNFIIAGQVLERLGFLVEHAENGREAFTMLTTSEYGYYDVIYMDIQMPVMDGYEATAAIRESLHPQAKSIPIIAMTANVFAEDIEKARIAGMNGHLGKPIITLNLIEETERALKRM